MIDLNKLAAELHEAAVEKGFWAVWDAEKKHLAKALSELGEVIRADSAGVMFEPEDSISGKPEGVVVELADFAMMLLEYAAHIEAPIKDFEETYCKVEHLYAAGMKAIDQIPAYELACILALDFTPNVIYGSERDGVHGGIVSAFFVVKRWLKVRGYDLLEIIRLKMEYNKSRPALHGRLY